MDSESKQKYEKYKMTVKVWEQDFKKQNNRIPSKVKKINKIIIIRRKNRGNSFTKQIICLYSMTSKMHLIM